ncbi:MAG TPA: hypothetical protein VML91_14310 [Burkholderiales bacterium]|nr:hypothetical protein [Burkholderiales bacterium]
MDFDTLATSRFKDPIFNDAYHEEWIDHVLYWRSQGRQWVSGARVVPNALDARPLYRKSERVRPLAGGGDVGRLSRARAQSTLMFASFTIFAYFAISSFT